MSDIRSVTLRLQSVMADEVKKDRAIRRVQKALNGVATLARIREELFLMRATAPLGKSRERIEQLIRLNHETLEGVKKSLTMAEADLLGIPIAPRAKSYSLGSDALLGRT
jgi:hypothetical protein